MFNRKKQQSNTLDGNRLLYTLSEEEKLEILDKLFPGLQASSTLVRLESPERTPSDFPCLIRGWIASRHEIEKVWLIPSPETKLEVEMRQDIAKMFPFYPYAMGFAGKMENIPSGSTIELGYSTKEGNFTHVAMMALSDVPEVRKQEKISKLLRIMPYLICPGCGASFDQKQIVLDSSHPRSINCSNCGTSYTYTVDNFNFLPDALKEQFGIIDTENVSSHELDPLAKSILSRFSNGLILDCGAGYNSAEYPNVINLEVAPYPSTDVLAVNEKLPFRDETFDAVFSFAVLEHVQDPFRSAREIVRVLKRNGVLYCVVPFLQPVHGYPNHYYNMTSQGLRNLFDKKNITILDHRVPVSGLPVWTLCWLLRSWADGLDNKTRENFLNMAVRDLIGEPSDYLGQDFVSKLGKEKKLEMAAATMVVGRKQ